MTVAESDGERILIIKRLNVHAISPIHEGGAGEAVLRLAALWRWHPTIRRR